MTQVADVFSNRYEIRRGIARGGMADVFLAQDSLLDRPVAVKVLFAEFARDPSFVERFRREAQAAANLNHPNIVGIYDWGQEQGTYFIVMEYVEGRSLRELIRYEERVPTRRAAELGAEIAGALAFAHRNGVVHRDVKPGNVLLTANGDVKVTDFGIARAGTSESLTQTGAVMGTANYFSPEQAQGLPVDGRSDVYSLGVVLYEMVTGQQPFTGDSPFSVAIKHVREQPVPPSQLVPDLEPDMQRIILAAMTKDPDRRYQSADDLRTDLVNFARGRPLTAIPTAIAAAAATPRASTTEAMPAYDRSQQYRAPAPSKKRWAGRIVVLLGLALLAAFVIAMLFGAFDTKDGGGGAETVRMPSVIGLSFDDAKARLEDRGFVVLDPVVESSTDTPGTVLAQDPDPNRGGDKFDEGTEVTLTIATDDVTVPADLVNMQRAQAEAALTEVGLVPQVVEQDDALAPPGTVLSTNPQPGAAAKIGDTVQLIVAKEPPVEIPDVFNLEQQLAVQRLSDAGFAVNVQTEPSNEVEAGRATRTDPPALTPLPRGSEVNLFLSTGPDEIPVPNVRNATEAAAIAELLDAGFGYQVQYEATGPTRDGLVLDQSPSGGTALRGSTVVIVVGRNND
jgi:serine/threonine-protein kinase